MRELPEGYVGGLEISDIPEDPDEPRTPGKGGWKVVGALESVDLKTSRECANILRTVMRDFRESHSDFHSADLPSTRTAAQLDDHISLQLEVVE